MSKTRSSTLRLSDVARHVVVPSGITSTAWPSVRAECLRLGIEFDPWQSAAGRFVFSKRADGSFAASVGGIIFSIPRQVGKTFFIGAVTFALCLLNPGTLAIWTAHQLATAGETFRSMQAMAKRAKVRPFIKQIRLGSGDEAIEFTNGSRILFGARERGFGLGFTKVGILILDEGQRLTEKTMDDLVPTMNQAQNPLMFIVGTPPRPADRGEEFKTRRRKALEIERRRAEGEDPECNMMYLEFSAEKSVRPDKWKPGFVDWPAVSVANPSYPKRTTKQAVLRMLENLRPESIRREAFGVWDEDQAGSRRISETDWDAIGVPEPLTGRQGYAVAFSLDGSRVALAGVRVADGRSHLQLIDAMSGDVDAGISGLADWLAERWQASLGIVISGAAGADVLRQALWDRRVGRRKVKVASTGEYFAACSMFDNAVSESARAVDAGDDPEVTHWVSEGQAALDESVAVVDQQFRGKSGAFGWEATVDGGDETPVEAMSLAYWLGRTARKSSSSGGGAAFA